MGVGSGVKKLTVENLTLALRHATQDVRQIEKAKLMGEKIRGVRRSFIFMLLIQLTHLPST